MHSTAGLVTSLHYLTALEEVIGKTPDISDYLDFAFYDWCWHNDNAGLGETKMVIWLGVSHQVISLMSYWVLTVNVTIVSRTTVSKVTNLEAQTDGNKAKITALDKAIQEQLNDEAHIIIEGGKGNPKDWSEHPFDQELDFQEEFSHVVSNEEVTEADDDFSPDVYDDTYISMDLALPKRGEPEPQFDWVTKRLCNANGLLIGKASDNPILDTRMSKVEYADGDKSTLSANLVAENMFTQIDEEENCPMLMDRITDHRFDEAAVKIQDAFVTTFSDTKCRR